MTALADFLYANSIMVGKCREWQGCLTTEGYGQFSFKGKHALAHRASWTCAFGAIPPDLQVLHSCDNPRCISPAHLFLGTQMDNIRDSIAKGRHYSCTDRRAVTDEQIQEILAFRADGWSYNKLAKKYAITKQSIYRYVKGIVKCRTQDQTGV